MISSLDYLTRKLTGGSISNRIEHMVTRDNNIPEQNWHTNLPNLGSCLQFSPFTQEIPASLAGILTIVDLDGVIDVTNGSRKAENAQQILDNLEQLKAVRTQSTEVVIFTSRANIGDLLEEFITSPNPSIRILGKALRFTIEELYSYRSGFICSFPFLDSQTKTHLQLMTAADNGNPTIMTFNARFLQKQLGYCQPVIDQALNALTLEQHVVIIGSSIYDSAFTNTVACKAQVLPESPISCEQLHFFGIGNPYHWF